ncbi:MAG: isovaleryl-CoA dehydrogenase [Pseudomonadales bacterium]|nr:isovaleryl-CoA dehydrogenase [Pseudomonadales bacterium]
MKTHEVFNQSPPLEEYDLFASDKVLQEAVQRESNGQADGQALAGFGQKIGQARIIDLGRQANTYLPVLKSFDRFGFRQDRVEFHPAYHELMQCSVSQGIHASPWEHLVSGKPAAPARNVSRQAALYMMTQIEPGHICPITMTNASVPTLLFQPNLAASWLPKITTRDYDPSFIPMADKRGVTLGMGMTEKQGGTDVRSNTTTATPATRPGPGEEYLLIGHKWFFSAPMCDAFLVLAQAEKGLSCFLLPRFLPDGTLNNLHIQRLKEKTGNRANASSEVEFSNAHAWLIGEEGCGIRNIIEMASWTRLDCAVSSAGMMRQTLIQALHHCQHRQVFGTPLIRQPLMQNVLADLALEAEACTVLAFRVSRAFDQADDDEAEAGYRRLMTPVAKYWNCKRAPGFTMEAMECLGGNGYVDETVSARLYREAPVNAIWEGSGNVMCLDVLRVLDREPHALDSVLAELEKSRGRDRDYDQTLEQLKRSLGNREALQAGVRQFVEQLALISIAGLLLEHAPDFISQTWCCTRLGQARGLYGCLPVTSPFGLILDRAWSAT